MSTRVVFSLALELLLLLSSSAGTKEKMHARENDKYAFAQRDCKTRRTSTETEEDARRDEPSTHAGPRAVNKAEKREAGPAAK